MSEPGDDVAPSDTPQPQQRRRWRAFCSACRQVFGLPDYERYLAHAAERHPGLALLTREQFCAAAIERRYGGEGPARCC